MQKGEYRILYRRPDGSEFLGHAKFDYEDLAISIMDDDDHGMAVAVYGLIARKHAPDKCSEVEGS